MTGSDGSALFSDLPWSSLAGAARLEALRARRTHPATLWLGPAYGVMERTAAGWLTGGLTAPTPAAARDALTAVLTADRHFRVVRADRFYRYGPDGPEPPRSTDRFAPPAEDMLLDPVAPPGSAELLGERWEAVPRGPLVRFEVTHDARRALTTHPEVALLAPRFTIAEERDGHWSVRRATVPSPPDARQALVTHLGRAEPPPGDAAAYRRAVLRLRREGAYEVRAAGRRFRIVRVETAVRVGPDGPEPPRPSDPSPPGPDPPHFRRRMNPVPACPVSLTDGLERRKGVAGDGLRGRGRKGTADRLPRHPAAAGRARTG